MGVRRVFTILAKDFLRRNALIFVNIRYGSIWNFRKVLKRKIDESNPQRANKILYGLWGGGVYYAYFFNYGCWIGLGTTFDDIPTFPHGLTGIFISNKAKLGKGVTIFHQVTIGSNTTVNSKNQGAPTIEDNVYIGCGAKIIGNVTVGHNSRIGANCIVVKDVPANSVVVMSSPRVIIKDEPMDNSFVKVDYH